LTFQKGATSTSYTIRTAVATSATRLVTAVFNNSGSTISKGSVIYINGRHSSNLPTIALAQANNEQNSYTTYALVESDINDQSSGVVIQAGTITNLNLPTSTYTDGQVLYLSPTVAGGYTTTKPLAPFHIVKLGTVTRAHPTFGTIQLKIENGWQLDELSDVDIEVVPADSTLFQFSRVDSLWHAVSITNAIGSNYIKPADTSVFQRKNIAAYSFKANATNAAANVTDQAYYNPGVQTYSGTITWTGTTAPSGTTNHSYNWTRIGNLVTLNITLNYGTAGNALTAVNMALPADCPTPKEQSGLGAATEILYFGTGQVTTSSTATNSNLVRAFLRVNATDNGYELGMSTSSAAYKNGNITIQYFVN
jgi:NDP-sugar pyrophosphorylase family protein